MPIAHSIANKPSQTSLLQQYWKLTKAPVVILMLITALVGALLATEFSPDLLALSTALSGISLLAGAGAAFNHAIDMQRDQKMKRTKNRPLVTQAMTKLQVIKFASVLMVTGFWLLFWFNNVQSAILSLFAMTGYALVYSQWLKPRTPQNITIGGLAGALPPLLGWVAMTGEVTAYAWLLVLIIFVWTPPHFWALAYYRQQDYKAAGVPMLCVTHGKHFTSLHLLLYTWLLSLVTLLPYLVGYTQQIYLIGSLLLNARFLQLALRLHKQQTDRIAQQTFRYSIHYLFILFALILIEPFIM
jgi:protoheme IX farnesyltransferase